MKKNPTKIGLFCISLVISITIIVYNIVTIYQNNQNLKNSFVLSKPNNVYAKQEELTPDRLFSVYPPTKNITSGLVPEKRKLDITLSYYKEPGDMIPQKIILKGTTIMACTGEYKFPNPYFYHDIYGFRFHPSYQKGWRIVIPFLTEQEYYESTETELKLFYVRTSDIKKLEKALVKQNLVENGWYLNIDRRLYEEGYYLSPDLYQSYFSFSIRCVICFWILIILLQIVLWKYKKEKFAKNL